MRMRKSPTGPGPFERSLHGGDDAFRRRVDLCLEHRGGGRRNEPGPHALDGRGKIAETLRLQRRHDFGSWTGELDRVMYDHRPAGAPDGFDHRVDVEWHKC